MPLYPFLLLAALFLAVLIVPPLVAAYIDYRRELAREGATTKAAARSADSGAASGKDRPGETDRREAEARPRKRDD